MFFVDVIAAWDELVFCFKKKHRQWIGRQKYSSELNSPSGEQGKNSHTAGEENIGNQRSSSLIWGIKKGQMMMIQVRGPGPLGSNAGCDSKQRNEKT